MFKRPRRRLFTTLGIAVVAAIMLTGLTGSDGSLALRGSRADAASIIARSNRVHPLLQLRLAREPEQRLSVIVQKKDPAKRSDLLARTLGLTLERDYNEIGAFQALVSLRQLLALALDSNVKYVTPNAPLRVTAIDADDLKTTHQLALGVDQVWNNARTPATGKGVTVAVLDTGINANHSAFAADRGNVIAQSVNVNGLGAGDGHGHGTHVAGLIKGKDAQGRYIGVAPDVRLISVKIADDKGQALESDLINGLRWVLANRAAYNIKVVNISASGSVPTSYEASPINAYVEQLWFAGVTVVVSAGNRGMERDATWYPPANDPYVISVGALDHNETVAAGDDRAATFSSRGKTQNGFAKPDVVAPGRRIVGPLAAGTVAIGKEFPERVTDGGYIRLSGTSQAAPIVTGLVALLLEEHPSLKPDQVKWLLTRTANRYPGQADGAGVVDIVESLSVAGKGGVGSANAGLKPAASIDPISGLLNTVVGLLGGLTSSLLSFDQTYWDQTYWDQTYWDQTYWDQTYWDQARAAD